MLLNSTNFECGSHLSSLKPLSQPLQLEQIPFSFYRQTDLSFLYSDTKDNLSTNIIELSQGKEGNLTAQITEEIMGVYEYCCFGDDHSFFLNKDGDIVYYDLNTKDCFFVEKQHPSPFDPIQIHNVGECFITCGGNVKNGLSQNQKIIKIWNYQDQQLVSKGRIVTGHSKAIQNSIILGLNRIVSFSTDKTIRLTNLSILQLEQVIPVQTNYYAGCQIDWNSCLAGGISQNMDIFDVRSRKMVFSHKCKFPVIQICQMLRLNENTVIFSDVNKLVTLDIRTWGTLEKGNYDGQRVSKISALNKNTLIIGNRDKKLQLWRFH